MILTIPRAGASRKNREVERLPRRRPPPTVLEISRLNAKSEQKPIFEADYGGNSWEVWGANEPGGDKTPFTDMDIIMDALVYCVDVTSDRDPVHDPNAELELQMEVAMYAKLNENGTLTDGQRLMWEFKVRVLADRKRSREHAALCQFEEI